MQRSGLAAEKVMESLDPDSHEAIHSLDRIRLSIAEAALLGLLVLGAPNLVLNILNDFTLSRPKDFLPGLLLILKPGFILYLLSLALFLARRALPLPLVTASLVGFLLIVGLQSLLDLGFIGSGMLYLLLACGLGALFFKGWKLALPLALSFLAVAGAGWLWVSGAKEFYFDPAAYATSTTTYAIRLVTVLFFLAILMGAIRAMNRSLEGSVSAQNELARKLYRAYEESEARYRELLQSRVALDASEERYKVLVENSEDLIYSLDPEGRITALNRTFERKSGVSREAYLGRSMGELIEDFPGYAPLLRCWEEVRTGLKPGTGTIDYFRAAAGGRMVRAVVTYSLVPVLDEEGKLLAVTGSHHDITQLVLAEEEARAGAAALERSLAEKLTLLREVHHRVKNNFQIIESLLSLQVASDKTGQLESALRDPRSRIQAMALVHESLYRSPKLDSIDFGAYARGLVEEIAASWSDGGIRVEIEADAFELDLDRSILCGLVLNELAGNAFKHAFRGTGTKDPRLRVSFGPEGSELKLLVEDNGRGLGEEARKENRRSLGMDLVESLAEQLRGTVEYSSGPGTKATLRFPINGLPGGFGPPTRPESAPRMT